MMSMLRTCKVCAAMFVLAAGPAVGQSFDDVAAQIEAELNAYEADIFRREAAPALPGTQAAADAELSAKQAELDRLLAQKAQAQSQEQSLRQQITTLLNGYSGDWADIPVAGTPEQTDPPVQPQPDPAPGGEDPIVAEGSEQPQPNDNPVGEGGTDVLQQPTLPAPGPKEPLATEDLPETLKPRVLSRPGAEVFTQPGSSFGNKLPVFSVLYVFDEAEVAGEAWLQVGESLNGPPVGWMRRAQSERWRNMLVMEYAPAADRDRVLFYRNPDDLQDLVTDWNFQTMAAEDYRSVAESRHDPNRLVAIEPERAVNANRQAYLMPILDWQEETFDNGQDTVLLELAGLNLQDTPPEVSTEPQQGLPGLKTLPGSNEPIKDFRIGIAFVVDTTRSMGPYLDQTKLFLAQIYTSLATPELRDRFRFAIVGYRDNTRPNPRIDYVTNVIKNFDEPVGSVDFVDKLFEEVDLADVSTRNWREDAFSGLEDAVDLLAWNEVDARLIFLITDASARGAGDELARNPNRGVEDVANLADNKNISLFIMHMLTPEAKRVSEVTEGYDDHEAGRRQYQRMQLTGNKIEPKYFPITGDNETQFRKELSNLRKCLTGQLRAFSLGQVVDAGNCDRLGKVEISTSRRIERLGSETSFDDDELTVLLDQSGTEVNEDNTGVIAVAVSNEIFRAQQEYLGTRNGVVAPAFYRAWVADRDLIDPRIPSLRVSVLMTRAQISDVAARLQDIVTKLNRKDLSTGEFFTEARLGSGRTVIDPKIRDFLPEYLADLPYCSKFLCIDRNGWERLDGDAQEELLREVERKLVSFKDLANSPPEAWLGLGDRSPENQVLQVPLDRLP